VPITVLLTPVHGFGTCLSGALETFVYNAPCEPYFGTN